MSSMIRECLLLIPCSGLDEFPQSLPEKDSQQVLSAWLALWHPSLIAQTHAAPKWQSADQPPHLFEGVLAMAPDCTQAHMPSDLTGTAERGGGWLIVPGHDWRALQAQCLDRVGLSNPTPITPDMQADFAALGYAYLQIQMLTRQLRYTSNLDQLLFDSQLDQAAQAALTGNMEEANKMLQSCFDQLGQERDHYYSLDVSLLDVTLLASTTLGSTVTGQLNRQQPTTFVASASLLREMQAKHPDVASQLRSALTERRACLAGGLDVERPHPLMNFDGMKRDLERGKAAYAQLEMQPPVVFTRFSFGQTSEMPLHLRRSGYAGSMLIAWQDGVYPSGSHAKFSWEASEGTFLNALAPPLVDAQAAATFLTLGRRIAESLDHQQVPVFMLVHWPNQYSPFFELFDRVVKRTPALGRWQLVDDFFEKTDQPYHQEQLPARKFVHDWADAAGSKLQSLLTATQAYHRFTAEIRALQNIANLSYQLENFHRRKKHLQPQSDDEPAINSGYVERGPSSLPLKEIEPHLAELADRVDSLFDGASLTEPDSTAIASSIDEARQRIAERFAKAAGHQVAVGALPAGKVAATLVINPQSSPQRITQSSSMTVTPPAAKWLYATGRSMEQRLSMVDVPSFGMLTVPWLPAGEPGKRREATLVQADGLLVNDFLEVQIDARSGAVRSLHAPGVRGNRLSLQVARREKASGATEYSQMQIIELRTVENSSVRGAIRACGTLMHRSQPTGKFEIEYVLLRGQRVLNITFKLTELVPLGGSPWSSAYVLRTAWPNESAILATRSCSTKQTIPSGKIIAPECIDIDEVEHHTHLLTGGLAFHQRVEERFLETLLGNGQSREIEVNFGIGVDLPNASATALQFQQPALQVQIATSAATPPTEAAWLMHVDAKQVLMQLESPLVDAEGNCAGMRIHLTELAGKSVTARIRALREVREAHRVDYLGGRVAKLTIEGDTTAIALRPNEMTFVDLEWTF